MRVTINSTSRQYLNSLNRNLSNLNKVHSKLASGREFDRVSEDTVSAVKAMQVRKKLAKLDMYESNLKTADSILSTTESCVMTVSSICQSALESAVAGTNGTASESDQAIIADQLRTYAKEIVQTLNTSYAGRTLFGGTVNDPDNPPFRIETNETTGEWTVTFNGQDVNAATAREDFPGMEGIFVDIGLGLEFGTDGSVNSQTALNISVTGPDTTGFGVDEDGDPKNLIAMILTLADHLEAGDDAAADKTASKINDAHATVLLALSDLGNTTNYIDQMTSRITEDRYSLLERQKDLEASDTATESINYSVAQTAYNATLQIASEVIPLSIFDFIR